MAELLNRARRGFESVPVPPSVREAALGGLERWLTQVPEDEGVLSQLADQGAWELLVDSFYQVIPFGTGGRRGPVGPGPNRINPRTLGTSIQGHAQYLRARHDQVQVVIAYDVRCFQDARGLYPADISLRGTTSQDFARYAARVYAANGVRVWIAPAPLSTPELSFGIRFLGAQGGLNVSASHNPPDDNGAKIYNHLGGQEIPPHDEALVDIVARVDSVNALGWDEGRSAGLIQDIPDHLHAAYVAANIACSQHPRARSAHVVFTPLHGTAEATVAAVLSEAGFRVDIEPTQRPQDGAFTNVPFRTPNPEVPQSMDRAVALARSLGADLVMACDPDADRLGVVVAHDGGWRFLNGNEMGALVVHALARPGGVVMKTEVTSGLVERVARAGGAEVVGNLLVGFKYIGEGIRCLEQTGRFQHAEGDFLVGVEESHGVLVTSAMRDKDAAGGALVLAELASLEKSRGRTLVDTLEQCWAEVGYVSNRLVSTVMRGAVGRARIESIQDSFRTRPPSRIGDREVTAFHDRRDPDGPFGAIVSNTDDASRNVLVFELGPDARLILRPSGTEPKNKIYAEVAGPVPAEVDDACRELAWDFAQLMLERVEMPIPRWALRVSDLVPVELKLAFAHEILPELVRRLHEGDPVDPWLDAALEPFGKDARGLVADAVAAFPGTTPQLRALFTAT